MPTIAGKNREQRPVSFDSGIVSIGDVVTLGTGTNSVTVGQGSTTTDDSSVTVGPNNTTAGFNSVTVGHGCSNVGGSSITVGYSNNLVPYAPPVPGLFFNTIVGFSSSIEQGSGAVRSIGNICLGNDSHIFDCIYAIAAAQSSIQPGSDVSFASGQSSIDTNSFNCFAASASSIGKNQQASVAIGQSTIVDNDTPFDITVGANNLALAHSYIGNNVQNVTAISSANVGDSSSIVVAFKTTVGATCSNDFGFAATLDSTVTTSTAFGPNAHLYSHASDIFSFRANAGTYSSRMALFNGSYAPDGVPAGPTFPCHDLALFNASYVGTNSHNVFAFDSHTGATAAHSALFNGSSSGNSNSGVTLLNASSTGVNCSAIFGHNSNIGVATGAVIQCAAFSSTVGNASTQSFAWLSTIGNSSTHNIAMESTIGNTVSRSIALGGASVSNTVHNGIAIGQTAQATGNHSVAVGFGATAGANAVVFGSPTVFDANTAFHSFTVNGYNATIDDGYVILAANDAPAVGDTGLSVSVNIGSVFSTKTVHQAVTPPPGARILYVL